MSFSEDFKLFIVMFPIVMVFLLAKAFIELKKMITGDSSD